MGRKVLFGAVLAATVSGLLAGQATAEETPEEPGTPPFYTLVQVTSDGELLPVCLNEVRITVRGNEIVDVDDVCVG